MIDVTKPRGSAPETLLVPEADVKALAYMWADKLERIEVYSSGECRVILEDFAEPEQAQGKLIDIATPELPPKLAEMNQRLIEAGHHGMSPWWEKQVKRMYYGFRYDDEICRIDFGIRGGRRSGKSITMRLLALYETVEGDHAFTHDDSMFLFLSAKKSQATEALKVIQRFCKLLGIDKKTGVVLNRNELRFGDLHRMIVADTASVNSVISMTCHGGCADEEAYWRSDEDGSNPAPEILAEWTQTFGTQRNAKLFHVSCPFSTQDAHHELIAKGTTHRSMVFSCNSWTGNPVITEARSHILCPDPIEWRRLYLAEPLSADETKFYPKPFLDSAQQPKDHQWFQQ